MERVDEQTFEVHQLDGELLDQVASCLLIRLRRYNQRQERTVLEPASQAFFKLPRIRDFRGVSPRSFDGRGNYSLGVNDQTIFPEIELDKIKRQQGMDVTIVTSAPTDEEGRDLLKMMGMPFAEK